MTTLTDTTARNPLSSVRECGDNVVEPVQDLNRTTVRGGRNSETPMMLQN